MAAAWPSLAQGLRIDQLGTAGSLSDADEIPIAQGGAPPAKKMTIAAQSRDKDKALTRSATIGRRTFRRSRAHGMARTFARRRLRAMPLVTRRRRGTEFRDRRLRAMKSLRLLVLSVFAALGLLSDVSAQSTGGNVVGQPMSVRRVTSGTTDSFTTVPTPFMTVLWVSGSTGNKTSTIPGCPEENNGAYLTIADGQWTAGTYPISVTPASGSIGPQSTASYALASNGETASFQCDSAANHWKLIGSSVPGNAVRYNTGTTLAVGSGDNGNMIYQCNGSPVSATIPQVGANGFVAGAFRTTLQNYVPVGNSSSQCPNGTGGTITLTPGTPSTVNGATSITIAANLGAVITADQSGNYTVVIPGTAAAQNVGPSGHSVGLLDGDNIFSKRESVTPVSLTDAATISLDPSLSTGYEISLSSTLGGSRTCCTLVNPFRSGQEFTMRVTHSDANPTAIAFNGYFFLPGATAYSNWCVGAGCEDLVSCKVFSDLKAHCGYLLAALGPVGTWSVGAHTAGGVCANGTTCGSPPVTFQSTANRAWVISVQCANAVCNAASPTVSAITGNVTNCTSGYHSGGNADLSIWLCGITATGAAPVTANYSATAFYPQVAVIEFGGSSTFAQDANAPNTSAATNNSPNITSGGALTPNDFALSVFVNSNPDGTTTMNSNNFTTIDFVNNGASAPWMLGTFWAAGKPAGSVNWTGNLSAAVPWNTYMVAAKP
jgi:hypothetical protein